MKLKVGNQEFGHIDDAKLRTEKRIRWDVVHQMMVESLSRQIIHHKCLDRAHLRGEDSDRH